MRTEKVREDLGNVVKDMRMLNFIYNKIMESDIRNFRFKGGLG